MPPTDPPGRGDYPLMYPLSTRWSDNDSYGHVNNVVYYAYFDTVANRYLIEAGVRVEKLGNSSVQYGIGIFQEGEDTPAAFGHFVHVFVERAANKSVPIPENLRTALQRILVA